MRLSSALIILLFITHCSFDDKTGIWKNSNNMHDIYELYNYESYIGCDFNSQGAVKHSMESNDNTFSFTCDSMGTRFFACSVDDACKTGKQRVRVHGIDSRKTQLIREHGGYTLAEYIKESVVSYQNGDTIVPESKAMQLENMLLSIASNSPSSCADWLIPGHLSNATCLGYVYTDLGVLYRQRASVDLEMAEMYYNKALAIIPNFCLAESYLVELQIKANDKQAADYQFKKACDACGTLNLDMELIRMAYKRKGWEQPYDSVCSDRVDVGSSSGSSSSTTFAPSSNNNVIIGNSCQNADCCGLGTEYVDGKCQIKYTGLLDAHALGFPIKRHGQCDE